MASGKHRKPKRQRQRQREQSTTPITAIQPRARFAGSRRFFTPLVWVVILLGLSAIFTSVKGISVTVKMEP